MSPQREYRRADLRVDKRLLSDLYRNETTSITTRGTGGEAPAGPFFEALRKFKDSSRKFHEFIAESEAKHNPRRLDKDKDHVALRIFVAHSCQYLETEGAYQIKGPDNFILRDAKGVDVIVEKIVEASRNLDAEMITFEPIYHTIYVHDRGVVAVMPLFKVYGRRSGSDLYVSVSGEFYYSVFEYLDKGCLSNCLTCFPRFGNECVYEIDPQINKYPLEFFCTKNRTSSAAFAWSVCKTAVETLAPFAVTFFPESYVGFAGFMFGFRVTSDICSGKGFFEISTRAGKESFTSIIFKTVINFAHCAAYHSSSALMKRLLVNGNTFVADENLGKFLLWGAQSVCHIFEGNYEKSFVETVNPHVSSFASALISCFTRDCAPEQEINRARDGLLRGITDLLLSIFGRVVSPNVIFKALELIKTVVLDKLKSKCNDISGRMNSGIARALSRPGYISLTEFKSCFTETAEGRMITGEEDLMASKQQVLTQERADESIDTRPRLIAVKHQQSGKLFISQDSVPILVDTFLLTSGGGGAAYIKNNFYEVVTTNGARMKILEDETDSGLKFVFVRGEVPEGFLLH